MIKRALLLAGPLLLLLGQLIAPGGSPDPLQRHAIILNNQPAWALAHQIFALAFAWLLWWLFELRSWLGSRAAPLVTPGAFLVSWALLADFGIVALQFAALDVVRALPADQSLAVLRALGGSANLLAFIYLPYLGFLVGLPMLAWGGYRVHARVLDALLLAGAGLLLALGGLIGSKIALIGAALLLVLFTLRWLFARSG